MKSFKEYIKESGSIDELMLSAKRSSKNISRLNMPQLTEKNTKNILAFLDENGVKYKKETVDSLKLKFAQANFHKDKIEALVKNIDKVKNKIVYITKDNYVLDGNHRIISLQYLKKSAIVMRIDMDFDKLIKLFKDFKQVEYKESYIMESSLSRLWTKIEAYDVGSISAFRGEFKRSENMTRTKELLAALLTRGYSVTQVKGSYIENLGTPKEKEVGEVSFFVADHKKSGTLRQDLRRLGAKYDQDSILYVPHKKDAMLIGTSKRDTAWPGMNKIEVVGKAKFGQALGKFFSRINGRVFAFESMENVPLPDHIAGLRGMHATGNRILKEAYDAECSEKI